MSEYLKRTEIEKAYGFSRSTFYRLRKDGTIPKPYYPVRPTMPRYLKSEIEAVFGNTQNEKVAEKVA